MTKNNLNKYKKLVIKFNELIRNYSNFIDEKSSLTIMVKYLGINIEYEGIDYPPNYSGTKENREKKFIEDITKKATGKFEVYDYNTIDDYIGIKCKKCGYEWKRIASKFKENPMCPNCIEIIIKSSINSQENEFDDENILSDREKYQRMVDKHTNGMVEVTRYKSEKESASYKCKKCENSWRRRADVFLERPFNHLCKIYK